MKIYGYQISFGGTNVTMDVFLSVFMSQKKGELEKMCCAELHLVIFVNS